MVSQPAALTPNAYAPTVPFRPAPGLGNAHAQTLFAAFARPRQLPPALRRERWQLPDGDVLHVDRLPAPPDRPHLIVLHGMEGSSRSPYVAALLRGAAERGWGATAPNARSCGGEPNLRPRLYHCGETEDPGEVLRRIRSECTGPVNAVGFSLGGNVLLRMLAEGAAIDAAVTISAPFDLQACVARLDAPGFFPWLYRRHFLRTLVPKALQKAAAFPGHLPTEGLADIRTIRDYDERVTAPLHGFADADDYYRRCASGPVLAAIRAPTLCIAAADDPFVPPLPLPETALGNPAIRLCITENGGHVGFVSFMGAAPNFWAEEQALAFLDGRH